MAIQIQRKQKIQETLDLLDESGAVVHTLNISLDFDEAYPRYIKAAKEVDLWREKVKTGDGDNVLAAYGEAIFKVLCAVLGADNAKIVTEFYENRPLAITQEVLPAIVESIVPKFDQIEAQKLAQIKEMRRKFK